MAVSFDKVNAGDVLYDYHSERAGNTTMRRWSNWEVRVLEVDREKRQALVSWNSNPARWQPAAYFKRLRRSPGKEIDPWMVGR